MIELSGEWSPPVVKGLLANHDKIWLFSVECGSRTTFTVEFDERCWTFASLSSARAKFQHEVAKLGNGNIAPGPEKRVLGHPGAFETEEGGKSW
jgi:hypothetical protein